MTAPPPRPSIVVTLVSGQKEHLRACLEAIRAQVGTEPCEVLVPYDDPVAEVVELQPEFPDVRFLHAAGLDSHEARQGSSREHHDALRTLGLAQVSGDVVLMVEDVGLPGPTWAKSLIEALERHPQAGAVGGGMACASERALNRAICLSDYWRYQEPLPDRESSYLSDANLAYRGTALEAVRPVWQDVYHETVVNFALAELGFELRLSPGATVFQNRGEISWREALRERFVWGRSFAGTRVAEVALPKRAIFAAASPALPLVFLQRTARIAWQRGGFFSRVLPVLPALAVLISVWSFGEAIGYLTGRPARGGRRRGTDPGGGRQELALTPPDSLRPRHHPPDRSEERSSGPRVSVVVASGAGGEFLSRCLDSLAAQTQAAGAEVVVADRCGEAVRRRLAEEYPFVRVVARDGERRPSVPELRAAGVDAARGEIVAVIEEHCTAPADWIERIAAAMRPEDAAIGGPILDADFERLRDWVVYFSEYHNYLPPWPEGERDALNDAGIAYWRKQLVENRTALDESYWTISLHPLLARSGGRFRAVPEIGVTHTGPFDFGYYLRQRYLLSRVWGGTQRDRVGLANRLAHLASAPIFPLFLLARMARRTSGSPRLRRRYLQCLPLMIPVVLAYTWGEWLGYLVGPGRALEEVE